MKKFGCTVCGYLHKGDNPPAVCPGLQRPGGSIQGKLVRGGGRLLLRATGWVSFSNKKLPTIPDRRLA